MSLLRFIGLLFVFLGVLASCAFAVGLLILMLKFWPVTLLVVATLGLFAWLLKKTQKPAQRRP